MRFTNYLLSSCFFLLLLISCEKEQTQEPESPQTLNNGMLILNEGLFQLNNSGLSWIDFSTGTGNHEFFYQKTGRLLGDTGNDLKRYGSKLYVVVNVSSTIEVLDASTGDPIKQISMLNGSESKQPRRIDFYGNHAFITCFDGFVDVLDTATLSIVKRIPVGLNPDGITRSGSRLYVSNSGGLNAPTMDSTVSVIDAVGLTELTKITVGLNPGSIVSDAQGEIYVIARGNYGSVPSRLRKINPQTLSLETTFNFEASSLEVMESNLLISYYDSGTSSTKIALFDAQTDQIIAPDYINLAQVQTLYGMHYRTSNKHIYLIDAQGYTNTGYVREYGSAGSYLQSFQAGLNPNSIVFYD